MAKRIVLADDEQDGLEMTADQLTSAGYEVILAHDGAEALELVTKLLPDMALLDIRMPHMTGYEVCEHIKNNQTTAQIPVLLITANSIAVTPEKVRNVKGDGYILRPCKAPDLIKRIRDCIGW
ncbi:MAG: two-component system response regulator [Deltaproteobacteria bacterium CG11_big_fil_rev_8_21_14_0_20_47_16]|nr:MAG: two-component system response regulator [Deltaproteobacteria bacterium CG11_big_fil_rev_8_21_14_0_20_47_16]